VTSRIVEVGSGSHNNASPGSQMLGTGCHGETSQLGLYYVFSDSHLITTVSSGTITSVSVSYQICRHASKRPIHAHLN